MKKQNVKKNLTIKKGKELKTDKLKINPFKLLNKKFINKLNHVLNNKNRKLLFIILIFIFILLIFIILFKINTLIKETLILDIEPQTLSIKAKNKDSLKIDFNISLTQSLLCRSSCNYVFKDLSKNKIIDEGSIYFKNSGRKSKNYVLSINETGTGKRIYLFELSCYNINNTFCNSERSFRYKTSTIIIKYELSPEENISKNYILKNIENLKLKIESIDFEYHKSSFVSKELMSAISKESYEYKSISESFSILEQNYKILLDKISEIKNFWALEDYKSAQNEFSKTEKIVNFLIDYSLNLSELNTKTINLFNRIANELNSIQENQDKINKAYKFFQITDKNKSDECNKLFSKTIDYIFYFKHGLYLSLEEFSKNVSMIENRISNILNEYYEKSYSLNKELYFNFIIANFTISEFSENISFFVNSSFELNYSESFETICNNIFLLNSLLEQHNKIAEELLSTNYSNLNNSSIFLINSEILRNNSKIIAYNKAMEKFSQINISFEFYDFNNNENIPKNTSELNFSNEMENITLNELKMLTKLNFSRDFYNSLEFCSLTKNLTIKELPKISFLLEEKNISFFNYTKTISFDLIDNPEKCCFNNNCTCCYYNSCKKRYPIIFVHGHLAYEGNSPESSMNSFSRIQRALIEYDYIPFNFDLKTYYKNENFDGLNIVPTTRASYYFITYYDVGTRIVSVMKHESIENYAIRLKETIDEVKLKTGADKVVIIAHSMGGLVSREYLMLFGERSVDKLITIASPHKGISGRTLYFCKLIGSEKECDEMSKESIFMKRLNSYRPNINIYNIIGSGCLVDNKDSDGVVYLEDAKLGYGEEYVIKGNCTDVFKTDLHSKLLNPEEYYETFNLILEILKN